LPHKLHDRILVNSSNNSFFGGTPMKKIYRLLNLALCVIILVSLPMSPYWFFRNTTFGTDWVYAFIAVFIVGIIIVILTYQTLNKIIEETFPTKK
jgi:hypothetical protein